MSQRILVIEDQADNRQILWDLLTNADFEVIEAENGEAGLAAGSCCGLRWLRFQAHQPAPVAGEGP